MDTHKEIVANNTINQALLLKIVQQVDISELEFSVRTNGLLKRVGINTIGELCSKTKLDFLGMESLSYRNIKEVEEKLNEIGLNLKPLNFPIATKKDGKRLPIADVSISFDILLPLSDEQYSKLKRGNIPHNMDEWFVYYERGMLYFYRWTGMCMFSVELDEHFHKHHVKTYVYNLDLIKKQKADAPETIKMILQNFARY